MTIAHINTLVVGSTGRIMLGISEVTRQSGHEVFNFSAKVFRRNEKNPIREIPNHMYYGSETSNAFHKILGQLTGFNGFFSVGATIRLLLELDKLEVKIIHLHNLHEFCINLPLLFGYIKKKNIRLIWTLHDCWSFTGHCPHFLLSKCMRWQTGCRKCQQLLVYPRSFLDTTALNWHLKRFLFSGVRHATIVTPSQWLAAQVKQSFLQVYPVKVINNGIDLGIFQPMNSDFRLNYHCEDKKIVLGVAFDWGIRKGADVFVELASRLLEDYQIVLVGTDDIFARQLPKNIISIHRTQNQRELAEIYSAADVFVNPTREDTFPTVNIESLACGTPVITFETGGSPEIVDETCGIVVPCDDVDAIEKAIHHVCEDKPFSQEACVKRASCFDKQEKFREYVELYEQIKF